MTRLALGALACLALASSALAGYYTIDPVYWNGGGTTLGGGSATLGGITAQWRCYNAANLQRGGASGSSDVQGSLIWRVVWHRTSPTEAAPTTASVDVAKYGHVGTFAEAYGLDPSHTGYDARANAQDYVFEPTGIQSKAPLGAGMTTPTPIMDPKGSLDDSHHGYIPGGSSFASDGLGNWVAFVEIGVIAHTDMSLTAGGNPSRFGPAWGEGQTLAEIVGNLRPVIVNGVQVANDFPGGSYPTSGFSQ